MSKQQWIYEGVEFKPGDRVMVVGMCQSFAKNGMGDGIDWDNAWVEDMDNEVFNTFTIDFIDSTGVHFVENSEKELYYAYPLLVLRNITAEEETTIEQGNQGW